MIDISYPLPLNLYNFSKNCCFLKAVLLSSSRALKYKVNKIYLNNTDLAYALSSEEPNIGNIRETVFLEWLRATHKITASGTADFKVGKYTFEVGGRKKGQRQIQNIGDTYIVKDDIEYGHLNEIPLWAFGLLY